MSVSLRPQRRIFVVDDSEESLIRTEAILESAGYMVATIRDGSGLFNRVFSERPDLVLCDLSMPGVAGSVLARLLKNVHGTGIRVLLHSGAAEPELAAQARQCGADGYIAKSASPNGLLARVRETLERETDR